MWTSQLRAVMPKNAISQWLNAYTARKLGEASSNPALRQAEREEDLAKEELASNKDYQTKSLALEEAGQDSMKNYLNTMLVNTKANTAAQNQSESDNELAGRIGIGLTGMKNIWDVGTSKTMSDLAGGIKDIVSGGGFSPAVQAENADWLTQINATEQAQQDQLLDYYRMLADDAARSAVDYGNMWDNSIITDVPDLSSLWGSLIS